LSRRVKRRKEREERVGTADFRQQRRAVEGSRQRAVREREAEATSPKRANNGQTSTVRKAFSSKEKRDSSFQAYLLSMNLLSRIIDIDWTAAPAVTRLKL
jgi:hypothetical protein